MFKIKKKRGRVAGIPQLKVRLTADKAIELVWNPSTPPHVFFDTNVLLGMNAEGLTALKELKNRRGFRYRYSMLNFVELVSHIADDPSEASTNPFRKFQGSFKKLLNVFDLDSLPSAEMIFMDATGLSRYLHPTWHVDPANIGYQVKAIAEAQTLEDIVKVGIDPGHYKKLRQIDGDSFLRMMKPVKQISAPMGATDEWGTWLGRFYSFMIYRASGGATTFKYISRNEQLRVIKFFDGHGGGMFLTHLKVLAHKALQGRNEYANDFYDMLQLILLKDPNRLFVTSDRPFFQYYAGPSMHRVVPWKRFMESAGNL